ncbi:MAG: Na/Pi symporter [Patescibacteria group bacterium]
MLTTIVIPVLSLVAVFLFAVGKFSNQIRQTTDDKLRHYLNKFTKTPFRGLLVGTFFTAIVQSSTATTVILVSIVGAGVLPFVNSLGVIFGANIGTALATQLVALKLSAIAPYIIIVGYLFSNFSERYKKLGKPIFYFGLIFFSLYLIGLYVEPLKDSQLAISLFSSISNIYLAILFGFIFTAIIQASLVTSSLAVLLAGAGVLSFEQAIGLILGANLGTTTTALIAAIKLDVDAKKVAMAHFLFNFLGVLMLIPVYGYFVDLVKWIGGGLDQEVATANILLNVFSAIIFLIFIKPFKRLIDLTV